MDTTSIQLTAASSSSSMDTTSNPSSSSTSNPSLSSSSPPSSWDVFLSFYGKDTRAGFISHLYEAFDQAGIQTFRDDPALEKGDEISPALFKAIGSSNKFVVVLSENYAYSPWCLDELVEILFCKRTNNQVVVIPVFYYVNPTDVRYHKETFAKAIEYHYQKKRYSGDMIDEWKSALAEIGDLSGYHLKKDAKENESDTIQEIVENVAPQTSTKVLDLEKYLFGIDSAVEEIYRKLSMESNDVRAIGICGMGGIGKTTTAKAFFNKYSNKFDICCFIENVKQQNSQGGSHLLSLLKSLLIQLLRRKDYTVPDVETGIRKLEHILFSKKTLIVFDDLDQSESLARVCNLFSAGSILIITTRDANLLNQLKVDISVDIFTVKELGQNDSLELFSYHAFRRSMPHSFKDLSLKFVTYAGGLPLALKVLGSSLNGRTDVFWKAKLEKVQEIPENKIQKILQLSYDELGDESEKAIFLDIVFFFVGKDKNEAVDVFNSCKFYPDNGIPVLEERCLLTIDRNNKFRMHNLIQDMGREVIREESRQGKCRRVYLCPGNARDVLQNLEEIHRIEALILDLATWTKKDLSVEIFERMPNLRLLEIIGANNIKDVKGSFKNSFHNLRCIRWHNCPLTYLPSNFCPQKLVSLDMPNSKFKMLWKNNMPIGQLTELGYLDLSGCVDMTRLPESIRQWTNLGYLNMSCCYHLKCLPEQLGDMKGLKILDASDTAIEQLPNSIGHLKELVKLKLGWCFNLTSLPNSIWKLKLLEVLYLEGCSKLERLPEQLGKMQSLKKLDASDTAIEEIPDSIGLLSSLQKLNLSRCKKVMYLPKSIWDLRDTTSISLPTEDICRINFPDTVTTMKLKALDMRCNIRLWLPIILSFSSLKVLGLTDEGESFSSTKPCSLSTLSNLRHLTLDNCTSLGSSFPELHLNLEFLSVSDYATLEQLPDLSSFKQLKYLYIINCISLQSLAPLPPHLVILEVNRCTSLQHVPDLSTLEELNTLRITGCSSNLKSVSLKQSSFLEGRRNRYFSFRADLPNREIPEWFHYKSSRCTISLEIPPILGDNFWGLVIWCVYKCKTYTRYPSEYISPCIKGFIKNETKGITHNYVNTCNAKWEAHSMVECISRDRISGKSGDIIKVSFQTFTSFAGEVKVEKCGAHVI